MICRRYFPGFVDSDESDWHDSHVASAEDAWNLPWMIEIKERLGGEWMRDKAFIKHRGNPSEPWFVIALLLTDDKRGYADL